jgi:hypothetical protein
MFVCERSKKTRGTKSMAEWERGVPKRIVSSTHLFILSSLPLKAQISVHIAVCKSTSKNVCDEMRFCTIASSA